MIRKSALVVALGVAVAARKHFNRDDVRRTFLAGYRYGQRVAADNETLSSGHRVVTL